MVLIQFYNVWIPDSCPVGFQVPMFMYIGMPELHWPKIICSVCWPCKISNELKSKQFIQLILISVLYAQCKFTKAALHQKLPANSDFRFYLLLQRSKTIFTIHYISFFLNWMCYVMFQLLGFFVFLFIFDVCAVCKYLALGLAIHPKTQIFHMHCDKIA